MSQCTRRHADDRLERNLTGRGWGRTGNWPESRVGKLTELV